MVWQSSSTLIKLLRSIPTAATMVLKVPNISASRASTPDLTPDPVLLFWLAMNLAYTHAGLVKPHEDPSECAQVVFVSSSAIHYFTWAACAVYLQVW